MLKKVIEISYIDVGDGFWRQIILMAQIEMSVTQTSKE